MGKYVNDDVMDAALNEIINNATQLVVCEGEPADRASALGANHLGSTSIGSGDFSISDGDTSGRKLTVSSQTGIDVESSGTADHIAIVDGSRLLSVTTISSQAVSAGGTMDVQAYDHEIQDAS